MIETWEGLVHLKVFVKEDGNLVDWYEINCHMNKARGDSSKVEYKYYETQRKLPPDIVEELFELVENPEIEKLYVTKETFDSICGYRNMLAALAEVTGNDLEAKKKAHAIGAYKGMMEVVTKET